MALMEIHVCLPGFILLYAIFKRISLMQAPIDSSVAFLILKNYLNLVNYDIN